MPLGARKLESFPAACYYVNGIVYRRCAFAERVIIDFFLNYTGYDRLKPFQTHVIPFLIRCKQISHQQWLPM